MFSVEGLMSNTTIRELYLPQAGIYTKEADCLRKFLSRNSYLQVLDISNNLIGDRGLDVLANGLTNQTDDGPGLSVLIIFNNQLTEKSASTLCNIIVSSNMSSKLSFNCTPFYFSLNVKTCTR